jgi:hypothetical protein
VAQASVRQSLGKVVMSRKYLISLIILRRIVGSQEHCPINCRVNRGFFYLWDNVLDLGRCQEHYPIPVL